MTIKALTLLTSALISTTLLIAPFSSADDRRPSRTWIERKWNLRRIIIVDSLDSILRRKPRRASFEEEYVKSGKPLTYKDISGVVSSSIQIDIPSYRSFDPPKMAIMVIEFDITGNVISPTSSTVSLRGRLNALEDIVLAPTDDHESIPYEIAQWFWGVLGDGARFSPSLCTFEDQTRYRIKFDVTEDDTIGNFGCREWAYQLKGDERPYFDVTSYEPRGTYIKPFIGWMRFEDDPRPVIGRQGKQWACLIDCPNGSSPGPIADIVKWCKQYGFALPSQPKKPARRPMFSNKNYPPDPNE